MCQAVDASFSFSFKVDIGSNVHVDENLLEQLKRKETSPGPFARGLLTIVFSDEELNGHSLFGKKCNAQKEDTVKPGLDPVRVNAVIGMFGTVAISIFLQLIRLDQGWPG